MDPARFDFSGFCAPDFGGLSGAPALANLVFGGCGKIRKAYQYRPLNLRLFHAISPARLKPSPRGGRPAAMLPNSKANVPVS